VELSGVFVELSGVFGGKKKVLVGVIYRSPDSVVIYSLGKRFSFYTS